MDITKIDKNFDTTFVKPNDLIWFSAKERPFSVHGVFYSEEENAYRRLPKAVADATNKGVAELSLHTAGGRVRFVTDSPYVAVRIEEPFICPMPDMSIEGSHGVSLFFDGVFTGMVAPSYAKICTGDPSLDGNGKIVFDGIRKTDAQSGEKKLVEIFLPLYNGVNSIYVGLKKGSVLQESPAYKHKKPVLFYGSSITQGGCASKPADDYISRLSRKLDFDFVNLGFSGSAFGEKVMADYISAYDASVFVLDYDHNAPDAEHLKKTHYALYETVRKANPIAPIILMTMPTHEGRKEHPYFKPRRDEILKSYARAKESGDQNIYLVDCYGCFGAQAAGECGTVDDCHPDSLGFLRMAERVYPVLDHLLNGKK